MTVIINKCTCHLWGDPAFHFLRRNLNHFLYSPIASRRFVKFIHIWSNRASNESHAGLWIMKESHFEWRDPVVAQVHNLLQFSLVPRVKIQTPAIKHCGREWYRLSQSVRDDDVDWIFMQNWIVKLIWSISIRFYLSVICKILKIEVTIAWKSTKKLYDVKTRKEEVCRIAANQDRRCQWQCSLV